MTQTGTSLSFDEVELQASVASLSETIADRHLLVRLNPDHPGFRDQEYRTRRNLIAQIAEEYIPGAPIPDAPYTTQEQEVWRTIWSALEPAHQEYACAEYLECVGRLELSRDRIPQLQKVTAKVEANSGFRLEPVAGLVEPRVFLESLASGVFLSTQYIRHHSTPLYTPEPDVAHEVIGHAVTLASERLAHLNRLVGEAVRRTVSAEALERLARVYWFTIEFGMLLEDGKAKAYGAGLLSSAGELSAMRRADVRPLDLDAASHQPYDPTSYQPILFCAGSFEEMYQTLRDYFIRWH
jgi:phenylalanine-4-hydroxylase